MEALVESFGLPLEVFRAFLCTCHGEVAGSAALAAYMNDAALPWEPNDIDVWLRVPELTVEQVARAKCGNQIDGRLFHRATAIKTMARMVFARMGFAEPTYDVESCQADRQRAYSDSDLHDADFIVDILCFEKDVSGQLRKVQVIVMADLSVQTLLQRFDLSACRVAWDGATFALAGGTEHDISCMRTLCHWPARPNGSSTALTSRQSERLAKYKARGFKAFAPV
jgi:hypothetical protein